MKALRDRVRSSSVGIGALAVVVAAAASGCAGEKPPAERVDNPAVGTAERPSALSYGAVTSTVKKGVTTQLDLIQMFGGANVTQTDRDGNEVWVYERTSSMSDSAGSSADNQFSAFFGVAGGGGGVTAGGGAGGSARSQSDRRTNVNSVRTLTVIIKFNPDKTVKDYETRATYF